VNATVPPAVFVSYAQGDRDRAETLERTLYQRGLRTSLDVLDDTRRSERSEIGEGDVLPESVLQELDQADDVVVLWTAAAAGDLWVALETAMANDLGVDVIYLRSGADDGEPPAGAAVVDEVDALVARLTGGETGDEPGPPSGIRLTPGRWRFDGHGVARQIELLLSLDDDGTVTGTHLEQGVTNDVAGEWEHDDDRDIVQLRLGTTFGSTSQRDTFRIHFLSEDEGVISAEDAYTVGLGALTYTITSVPT
jgi:hypothetical protein